MPKPRRAKTGSRSHAKPVHSSPLRVGVILGSVVVAALLVRLMASRGDLWLDEILSVELARSMTSVTDAIFATSARIDNNHVLNTSWLYAITDGSPVAQRLHSVIAGTASVVFAYLFALRWGTSAALFAAALFGSSFVMITYGSEARGYGLLVGFALLAMTAIDRALNRRSIGSTLLFWAACILGMLAHALFVEVFIAIVAWTLWYFLVTRDNRRELASFVVQYHIVPLGFTIGLYIVMIQHMQVLGANPSNTLDVIAETASFLLGLPRDHFWSRAALLIAVASLAVTVVALRRLKDDSWMVLLMLCAGAPAIVMIVTAPSFVLPRYFIVPATGMLLAFAFLLGRLFDRGGGHRAVSVLALAAMFVANSQDTAQLLSEGRGHYSQAVQDMAANTPGSLLRVGGDHEFRQRTMLRYYGASLPAGKTLEYVPIERLQEVAPDWVVMHSFDPDAVPATPAIFDGAGREYRLFRTYPAGPLSGWHWYVYRR